ncbi:hypothetical protein [Zavarzinella formosa]|uniref:hypothetical protein n=1 Tax=Zavarzinella formosa TaxID=360055 RepID=UPI0002DF32CA|nr:hypothetical protein [Zavarzinella formosa]
MTDITGTPARIIVRTEGLQGPPGAPGEPGDNIAAAPRVSPVFLTDSVVLSRNNAVCVASIADFLAAIAGPTTGGTFDFSNTGNSGLAAGAM